MAKPVETVFAMAETLISRMNERLVPTPRAGPLNVSFVGGSGRIFGSDRGGSTRLAHAVPVGLRVYRLMPEPVIHKFDCCRSFTAPKPVALVRVGIA